MGGKKKLSKKHWILLGALVLLVVLFVPFPVAYKDGGTQIYSALTYKVVKWNRILDYEEENYKATRVYFFPKSFRSYDALWELEGVEERVYVAPEPEEEESFLATVLDISVVSALVEPLEGEEERKSSDKIRFSVKGLDGTEAEPGDIVEIVYDGTIMESYPAGITVSSWRLSEKNKERSYTGQWLDKEAAEGYDSNAFDFNDMRITKIYADCIFARPLPLGQAIKLNGTVSNEWCIGDYVTCTYENACYDPNSGKMEADLLTIEESDWKPELSNPKEIVCYKPVIYLYPEEETEVCVELTLEGKLTCTYPTYHDGWTVTALPDGTLTDAKGQIYNYLYWEGEADFAYDFSEGFCVKGEETAAFLEDALEKLGLTRREANEFIVYWLPMMEQNPYNIISFQWDNYTEATKLAVSPEPDTLLRVFMVWKATGEYTELPEQELTASERTGFTVVEWGGTEVK